jgi:threonine synthase
VRFRSTRGGPLVDLRTALTEGLAPDGGLYMPADLPPFPPGWLRELALDPDPGRTGGAILVHLLGGEGGLPHADLEGLAREALDFPLPLVQLQEDPAIWILELFHGPTLAFKDVGARVMARLLAAVMTGAEGGDGGEGEAPITVLAATSGDTGGAVASAFLGVPGTRVVVLYPEGQVSPRQEAQFTTLGRNTRAVRVAGTFDDCQRLVKEAFADSGLRGRHRLTSANSINIGRLIPQIVYHVHARLILPGIDGPPDMAGPGGPTGPVVVSVPSGNFGNLAAGLLARRMGLPVDRFLAATNVNDVVPGYLVSGTYTPRPSRRTLSSAMDVGDPSNLERIQALYGHRVEALREDVEGSSWTDQETRDAILRVDRERNYLLDPHGAVGLLAMEAWMDRHRGDEGVAPRGIVLATAHPAKFAEGVEPVVGRVLPLPEALAARMGSAPVFRAIPPRLQALVDALEA